MIQAGEEPQPLAATPSEWQPSEVRAQSALFIRFLGWWEGRNSWGHCNTHTPEALVSKVRAWLSGLGLDEVGCVCFVLFLGFSRANIGIVIPGWLVLPRKQVVEKAACVSSYGTAAKTARHIRRQSWR